MLATNLPHSRVTCSTDDDVTNAYALFLSGSGEKSVSGEPPSSFYIPSHPALLRLVTETGLWNRGSFHPQKAIRIWPKSFVVLKNTAKAAHIPSVFLISLMPDT